jgi:hypothetical protein
VTKRQRVYRAYFHATRRSLSAQNAVRREQCWRLAHRLALWLAGYDQLNLFSKGQTHDAR